MAMFNRIAILISAFMIVHSQVYSEVSEVNIALAKWGVSATASSVFSSDYSANNAIDGKWMSSDSDKWNSISGWNGANPHWLIIDLSVPRKIHKIVIRHEGVVADGQIFNTSDYRLQYADSPSGPWKDIGRPVKDNKENVTTHEFRPFTTRFIRLLITQGEQASNDWARIFEVEVFALLTELDMPLAGIEFDHPYKRKTDTGYEVKMYLDTVIPEKLKHGSSIHVLNNNRQIAQYDASEINGTVELWAPVTGSGRTCRIDIAFVKDGKRSTVNSVHYTASEPGYFADGTVHIISSSHQDIAWMNSPEICIRDRDKKVITPALNRLKENPELCFSVETTLQLMEYLERHPEKLDEIRRLTERGQLEWGATYQQPYESMYPGESLIRQVYLGRKWLKKALPGCDSHIAWSPDVPGRAMQMPQILSKAGIHYIFMSRHEEGLYNWLSPDGSGVIAYSPGHYHVSGMIFRAGIEHGEDGTTIIQKYKSFDESAVSLSKKLRSFDDYYRSRNIRPEFGVVMSSDFTGPVEMDEVLMQWAAVRSDHNRHFSLPGLKYSTGEQFFKAVAQGNPRFSTITGERPNVWLYIHGPTHHKAMDACREAGWVLPAAETFAAIDAVISGDFTNYPSDEFREAWSKAIYPDHGWGGKNGHITDKVFREAFEAGRDTGREILIRSIRSISECIDTRKVGVPVFVFNHLSWKRTGPVGCTIDMFGAESSKFRIVDTDGNTVPHQVTAETGGFMKDGTLRVIFIGHDIPPVGYATYYIVPADDETEPVQSSGVHDGIFENEWYRIEFAPGGLKGIYDKELGRQLLNTEKFVCGEVFTMRSVGNGAGEFADVQQPDMEGFEKLSDYNPSWACVENGPVFVTMETSQAINHCTVRQRVRLFNNIKRIDFETDILGWDGTKNREFRMAFPLAMDDAGIAYNVPMGAVEAGVNEIEGAAGERYTTECSKIHPREVIDWFSASNGDFGITCSSSVAVFDWIDPTDNPVTYPVLQPVLLASRKSCHGEGNWYLQTGDHTFRFSLFSHKGDWRNGWKNGSGAVQQLTALIGKAEETGGSLPEVMSFCDIDAENVYVSTIKKCDDDNSVIVRLCEIEGSDTEAAVSWFSGITDVKRTNIIEEDAVQSGHNGNNFPVYVGHHAIETYKIIPGKRK